MYVPRKGLREVVKRGERVWTLKCGHTIPARRELATSHVAGVICQQCLANLGLKKGKANGNP